MSDLPPVPFLVETEQDFELLSEHAHLCLVQRDDLAEVAVIWYGLDDDWHGIRPVTEDDPSWSDLPASVRSTLAVPVGGVSADEFDDEQSFLPFTVLWHSAMSMVPVSTLSATRTATLAQQGDAV